MPIQPKGACIREWGASQVLATPSPKVSRKSTTAPPRVVCVDLGRRHSSVAGSSAITPPKASSPQSMENPIPTLLGVKPTTLGPIPSILGVNPSILGVVVCRGVSLAWQGTNVLSTQGGLHLGVGCGCICLVFFGSFIRHAGG